MLANQKIRIIQDVIDILTTSYKLHGSEIVWYINGDVEFWGLCATLDYVGKYDEGCIEITDELFDLLNKNISIFNNIRITAKYPNGVKINKNGYWFHKTNAGRLDRIKLCELYIESLKSKSHGE